MKMTPQASVLTYFKKKSEDTDYNAYCTLTMYLCRIETVNKNVDI
jgi:hypothetical protein